jgi:hypothetical protein
MRKLAFQKQLQRTSGNHFSEPGLNGCFSFGGGWFHGALSADGHFEDSWFTVDGFSSVTSNSGGLDGAVPASAGATILPVASATERALAIGVATRFA